MQAPTNGTGREEEGAALRLPAVALPKGGGAIRGIGEKFAANPVTGTGTMTIPIAVSPGRAGFTPSLALSYDSGSGNGPFGFGWTLSLPSVTRRTDRGLPRYDDAAESDVYVIAGADDLVPFTDAAGVRHEELDTAPGFAIHRYRPRIEGGFARIERWTERSTGAIHWRSISRDNVTTLFGRTEESRVADPDDPRRVFEWKLCESYDDRGNAMRYEYEREDDRGVDTARANERNRRRGANRYLKRIHYGNRTSRLLQPDLSLVEWLFEVVFDYDEGHYEELPLDPQLAADAQHRFVLASEAAASSWTERPDPFSSHRGGFELRTSRRCRRVLSFHRFPELGAEPCLVRSTELEYHDLDYSQPPTVEEELAHAGSTRFASFLTRVTQSAFERDPAAAPVVRGDATYLTYLRSSYPPVDFEYSRARIDDTLRELDEESLENLPAGVDGSGYQWVDLDGEGVAGVLAEHGGGWYYKPNLGDGRLGAVGAVRLRPATVSLGSGGQLLDLAGDGQLDLVTFAGPTPGLFERTTDEGWESFAPFRSLPHLPWSDPNLRFVDLTGDGHADVLITEHEVFTWHPSLAEEGFGGAQRRHTPLDEEEGARLVFADGTQSVYLADMCGDGLTALVRVRNGEIAYWPNLGYGRFGAKVTMDAAPHFDHDDQFDQRRIRLADIDGSGTNDVIYLGHEGARVWFNQSGNRWSAPRTLAAFPPVDTVAAVSTTDLLGNGTACLVWSSGAPGAGRRTVRYVDLMGGIKPHLLTATRNNMGAETRVSYAPSTRFYLADKAAGRPWITRLAFPVHVVERVEIADRVSRNRFVTRYAYHHGHFDGVEREFRGFGMVEQWDTEAFSSFAGDGVLPAPSNADETSHVPPVYTRSWFHTGAYLGREHVSDHFAGSADGLTPGEYWREPSATAAQARALLLDDTTLPEGLATEEEREACRALKGAMLRQESYALDGSARERNPFTVTEQSYALRLLQRRGDNAHAVVLMHPREAITFNYERDPTDPRVAHTLTIEVDDFGLVRRSASVGYPRRAADPALPQPVRDEQGRTRITVTTNDVTNLVDLPNDWRTPLVCDTTTYELTGLALAPGATRLTLDAIGQAARDATVLDYELSPTAGQVEKRVIERTRTLFRRDDLAGALAPNALESRAILFERYRLAFTPGLVAQVYGGRVTDAMLSADGGYVQLAGDAGWWIPSGRVFHSPDPGDSPAEEVAYARGHFFHALRHRDPFHTAALSTESAIRYDGHDLLVVETRDALGNRVTVGERNVDPDQPLVTGGYDYRTLQPILTMDANRNRSAVAVDALGMVVATARTGKPEDVAPSGDSLAGVERNLTAEAIAAHLADPIATAPALLGRATTRMVYDLFAFGRTAGDTQPTPALVSTIRRETHDADLAPPASSRLQVALSYSDGFGREVQQKIQGEGGGASPRWIGSGWTVFDNKGAAVRRFEPFFTPTHAFESDARVGVSDFVMYDPAGRVVGTLHPDHTWEKSAFTAWREERWDASDTVLAADPALDADVGGHFARLTSGDYLPTWHARRAGGALGSEAAASARKAEICADTPTVTHTDALGRAMLTVAHNRYRVPGAPPAAPPVEERPPTRVTHDIEGNATEVVDARDIVVARYDYDVVGNRIHVRSSDAGERWTLSDVLGKPVHVFDTLGRQTRTTYDALRRPTATFVRAGAAAEETVGRMVYGEGEANAISRNLRGRVVRQFDQCGVVVSDAFDFKGNPLRSERRLTRDYRATVDWSGAPPMEATSFVSATTYDALDRPVTLTSPDGSVLLPSYNAAGKLERVDARLRGSATVTPFVTAMDYNARGQRTRLDRATTGGSGITTRYEYDTERFRVARITTRRNGAPFDGTDRPGEVQDLRYTYDAVGNVSHVSDEAQQTVFFRNRRVEPAADYVYDALHRLLEATGREQLGQNGAPVPTGPLDFAPPVAHPGDGNAMGRYVERFTYDQVGNLLALRHIGSDPAAPGWKRCYQYATDSNRLLSTGAPNDPNDPDAACAGPYAAAPLHADRYAYDAHGNMTAMPHLPAMRWDHRDELQASATQAAGGGATPETTWYTYDAAGQRVRKVVDHAAAAGVTPVRRSERIYLGGFELYREYAADGVTPALGRDTLHLMAGAERIALVETRTDVANATPLVRHQFGTLVGSASLELDDGGAVISYEEYYPYGASSYRAARNATEGAKRYRYTARERDEETGLCYHGVRYYAPWLGRWTAADPIGVGDGVNVYQYVAANPVRMHDPGGTDGTDESSTGTATVTTGDDGKPVYTSTGDQVGKDAGKLGKKLWEATKDSDEVKGAKRLLLDPQLSRLKTGFEKDWKEGKGSVVLGGALVVVPSAFLMTYFMINDQKLDVPVVGELRTRELGFMGYSGLLGLGSEALFGDKAKIDVSYENKDGKERFGYQQSMPFMTDKLKLDFDARFGTSYDKLGLGFTYKPNASESYAISGSGENDAGKYTFGAKLQLKFPIAGAPFQFGATGAYKTSPDAGAPNFTGGAEALVEPRIGGTRIQFGFQGFLGATPPKDGPFMPKTDLDIVPKWPVPMYTPSGSGVFFSITIPTETVKKK